MTTRTPNSPCFELSPCDVWERRLRLSPRTQNKIDSVVSRYAHGECHVFTHVALGYVGGNILALMDKDGLPVHSFLSFGHGLYFDAYGLNRMPAIKRRYAHFGELRVSRAFDDKKLLGLVYDDIEDSEYMDDVADAREALSFVLGIIENLQRSGKTV